MNVRKYEKSDEQKSLEEKIERYAAEYLQDKSDESLKINLTKKIMEYFEKYKSNFFAKPKEFHENKPGGKDINYKNYMGTLFIVIDKFLKSNINAEVGKSGKFIPYMYESINLEFSKELLIEFCPNSTRMKDFREIQRKLKAKQIEVNFDNFKEMGFIMGWGFDRIEAAWNYVKKPEISYDSPIKEDDDSDGTALINTIEDSMNLSPEQYLESKEEEEEKNKKRYSIINYCFKNEPSKKNKDLWHTRKDDDKKYLSAILTFNLKNALLALESKPWFNQLVFVDDSLFQEIKTNQKLTMKEIAPRFNKDPTDASRKWKTFQKLIQSEYKKCQDESD